ncbi:fasciclin domain-containing protein [Pedobacter sp. Leaf250]|uniref:fasciclin domain-containing protein n=1 Tax=Pedobacter sp. Leaf250 TaxID=2876559 RepID=UPI001E36F62F|nr:fasciclin domain-containing protein [Pedobacter sp. Leaf250]
MKLNIFNTLLLLSALIWLNACKNVMEEHTEIVNVDNTIDVFQKVAAEPNLSKFSDFLRSTGYDKLLASSQNYTVWAPTNDALATLDVAISSDPAKLKDFVANHIALTTIAKPKSISDTLRVQLINKKFASLIGSSFEDAGVIGNGSFVKNGAVYTINKAIPTKQNIWEYMLSSNDAPVQTNYISNITTMVVDTANAVIIGYTSLGAPIFAPNPPMVSRNLYWSLVADLRAENQQYTFFMLQDAAFNSETAKLTPYFSVNDKLGLVADFTVKGIYSADKLPDTLTSTRGVKIPVSKAAVVKSYRASNGIVHVMSALPFRLKDKIPVFKIEGENPSGFRSDRTGNTYYRTKLDNLGVQYKDIEVYSHGVSEYFIRYLRGGIPVVKYKVYARAISGAAGDAQVANFTQRYFIYNPLTSTPTVPVYDLFATQTVTPLNYNEVLLGEYTPKQYGLLDLRLTAAASAAVNVNTLILDYLRFEPILP